MDLEDCSLLTDVTLDNFSKGCPCLLNLVGLYSLGSYEMNSFCTVKNFFVVLVLYRSCTLVAVKATFAAPYKTSEYIIL